MRSASTTYPPLPHDLFSRSRWWTSPERAVREDAQGEHERGDMASATSSANNIYGDCPCVTCDQVNLIGWWEGGRGNYVPALQSWVMMTPHRSINWRYSSAPSLSLLSTTRLDYRVVQTEHSPSQWPRIPTVPGWHRQRYLSLSHYHSVLAAPPTDTVADWTEVRAKSYLRQFTSIRNTIMW